MRAGRWITPGTRQLVPRKQDAYVLTIGSRVEIRTKYPLPVALPVHLAETTIVLPRNGAYSSSPPTIGWSGTFFPLNISTRRRGFVPPVVASPGEAAMASAAAARDAVKPAVSTRRATRIYWPRSVFSLRANSGPHRSRKELAPAAANEKSWKLRR